MSLPAAHRLACDGVRDSAPRTVCESRGETASSSASVNQSVTTREQFVSCYFMRYIWKPSVYS